MSSDHHHAKKAPKAVSARSCAQCHTRASITKHRKPNMRRCLLRAYYVSLRRLAASHFILLFKSLISLLFRPVLQFQRPRSIKSNKFPHHINTKDVHFHHHIHISRRPCFHTRQLSNQSLQNLRTSSHRLRRNGLWCLLRRYTLLPQQHRLRTKQHIRRSATMQRKSIYLAHTDSDIQWNSHVYSECHKQRSSKCA